MFLFRLDHLRRVLVGRPVDAPAGAERQEQNEDKPYCRIEPPTDRCLQDVVFDPRLHDQITGGEGDDRSDTQQAQVRGEEQAHDV